MAFQELRLFVHDQVVDHFVQIAFQNRLQTMQRQADAVVGHTALREVVGANPFTAVACSYQAFAGRILLRLLLAA